METDDEICQILGPKLLFPLRQQKDNIEDF